MSYGRRFEFRGTVDGGSDLLSLAAFIEQTNGTHPSLVIRRKGILNMKGEKVGGAPVGKDTPSIAADVIYLRTAFVSLIEYDAEEWGMFKATLKALQEQQTNNGGNSSKKSSPELSHLTPPRKVSPGNVRSPGNVSSSSPVDRIGSHQYMGAKERRRLKMITPTSEAVSDVNDSSSYTDPVWLVDPPAGPRRRRLLSGISDSKARDPTTTESNVSHSSTIKSPIAGFVNSGNSCYVNASVQSLMILRPFVAGMLSPGMIGDRYTAEDGKLQVSLGVSELMPGRSMVSALVSVIDISRIRHRSTPVRINFIREIMGKIHSSFAGSAQQDADEFLLVLNNQLNSEICQALAVGYAFHVVLALLRSGELFDVFAQLQTADNEASNAQELDLERCKVVLSAFVQPVCDTFADRQLLPVRLSVHELEALEACPHGALKMILLGLARRAQSACHQLKVSLQSHKSSFLQLRRDHDVACLFVRNLMQLSPVYRHLYFPVLVTITCTKCGAQNSHLEHQFAIRVNLPQRSSSEPASASELTPESSALMNDVKDHPSKPIAVGQKRSRDSAQNSPAQPFVISKKRTLGNASRLFFPEKQPRQRVQPLLSFGDVQSPPRQPRSSKYIDIFAEKPKKPRGQLSPMKSKSPSFAVPSHVKGWKCPVHNCSARLTSFPTGKVWTCASRSRPYCKHRPKRGLRGGSAELPGSKQRRIPVTINLASAQYESVAKAAPISLQALIAAYFRPENLPENQKCSKCDVKGACQVQRRIARAPNVLCVVIKRFEVHSRTRSGGSGALKGGTGGTGGTGTNGDKGGSGDKSGSDGKEQSSIPCEDPDTLLPSLQHEELPDVRPASAERKGGSTMEPRNVKSTSGSAMTSRGTGKRRRLLLDYFSASTLNPTCANSSPELLQSLDNDIGASAPPSQPPAKRVSPSPVKTEARSKPEVKTTSYSTFLQLKRMDPVRTEATLIIDKDFIANRPQYLRKHRLAFLNVLGSQGAGVTAHLPPPLNDLRNVKLPPLVGRDRRSWEEHLQRPSSYVSNEEKSDVIENRNDDNIKKSNDVETFSDDNHEQKKSSSSRLSKAMRNLETMPWYRVAGDKKPRPVPVEDIVLVDSDQEMERALEESKRSFAKEKKRREAADSQITAVPQYIDTQVSKASQGAALSVQSSTESKSSMMVVPWYHGVQASPALSKAVHDSDNGIASSLRGCVESSESHIPTLTSSASAGHRGTEGAISQSERKHVDLSAHGSSYGLQSMILHRGESIHSGHYVAHVKRHPEEAGSGGFSNTVRDWVLCNDESVTPSRPLDSPSVQETVYIAFYVKE